MNTMELFMVATVVLIALIIIAFYFLGVFKQGAGSFALYERRPYLLSPAELIFFNTLVQGAGPDKYVLSKVRIADLLQVAGLTLESDAWWKSFSTIAKKHVDFVICIRMTMEPQVIVELDDRTHKSERAQKRDRLVNDAFKAAGYPILHIPVGAHGYDTKKLAQLLTQAIKDQARTANRLVGVNERRMVKGVMVRSTNNGLVEAGIDGI